MANLTEIGAPDPVPLWPPAPGWYVVGGVLVLVAIRICLALIRHRRANRYRRDALELVHQLAVAFNRDPTTQLAPLPGVLKRAALVAFPRTDVAALSGAGWHHFLDQTIGEKLFADEAGATLDAVSYDPRAEVSEDAALGLLSAAERWLRRHRLVDHRGSS